MLTDLISKRIRELRVTKNLTQEKFAEKASVDFSYLGKIERGQKNNISIEMLDRIINALEIDYDDFFHFLIQIMISKKFNMIFQFQRIRIKF